MTKYKRSQQTILAIWIALIVYAFLFAPLASNELEHTIKVLTMQNASENMVLFAIFSLMGLWPMILAPLLLYTNQYKVRPWPFWFLSFGLGFFALAPYIALRKKTCSSELPHRPRWWKWWRSKMLTNIYAIAMAFLSLFFLSLMVFYKDHAAYFELFRTYRFVHVMTLDFLALHALAVFLIYNDRTKKGASSQIEDFPIFVKIAVITLPAFGPAIYPILKNRYSRV
mgnify:CR=1 FL=1